MKLTMRCDVPTSGARRPHHTARHQRFLPERLGTKRAKSGMSTVTPYSPQGEIPPVAHQALTPRPDLATPTPRAISSPSGTCLQKPPGICMRKSSGLTRSGTKRWR